MSKQDRQGVRTASDLERKYKFGQDLTEISKIANNANRAATNAQSIASNAAATAADAKATADGVDAKATNAEETATALESRVSALEQNSGSDVGLSIVDGLLCITYEG